MANYDLTYEGSRVQNILDTGDELRDAGYIFRGEATPSTVPGTPTERVAYIGGPGTYTNFGGSTVVPSGSIGVFKYTGSAWSNQVIACTVPISTSVQNNDTTVPTGKAVKTAVDAEATARGNAISSEASARQLGDSTLQGSINTVSAAVTAINNAIGNGSVYAGIATPSSTPASGKVFYLAFTAGTYTNFNSLEVPQGINILKNNGSTWLLDSFLGIDDAPTQGSANLVKSGGVLNSIIQNGPAFDLSAYNAEGGVLATYADLSAALTALNALPADFKKGGMSMKFVQTSDNIYKQYRCKSQSFTIDINDWYDENIDVSGTTEKIDIKYNRKTFEAASLKNIDRTNNNVDDIYKNISLDAFNDKLFVADEQGNIICKLDKDGLQSIAFINKDGLNIEDNMPMLYYNNCLYIVDEEGYVIAKFNNQGIEATKIKDKFGGLRLYHHQLFSIGDSLSAANKWQLKCANDLGCTFDANGNVMPGKQLSSGGTLTAGGKLDSAFFRVKNLFDQNVISGNGENAIIVFENINDVSYLSDFSGNKNDTPLVPVEPIETEVTVPNFNADYLNSVKAQYGAIGAIFTLVRTTPGKIMTINTLPTTEGDVIVKTGWDGTGGPLDYYVHVVPQSTPQETLAYIVEKILEYNYTGVSDFQGNEQNEVVFSAGNYTTYLGFEDAGNTGMSVTITDTDSAKTKKTMFFIGDTLDDWADLTKWKDGDYMTIWRAYKSCIQYILQKYPKAHLFIAGFPSMSINPSNYLLPNGTYDYTSYMESTSYIDSKNLRLLQKEIADYYNIPYLDIAEKCGFSIANYSEFYHNNNAHPKDSGYERIGSLIASEIKKYI